MMISTMQVNDKVKGQLQGKKSVIAQGAGGGVAKPWAKSSVISGIQATIVAEKKKMMVWCVSCVVCICL